MHYMAIGFTSLGKFSKLADILLDYSNGDHLPFPSQPQIQRQNAAHILEIMASYEAADHALRAQDLNTARSSRYPLVAWG